ncbi:MAG: ArnT family glycosyltransferase [Anaerolineaceae bacterium]
MEEPSVLDYLKEKLNPRKWGKPSEILGAEPQEIQSNDLPSNHETKDDAEKNPVRSPLNFPWRILLALVFALVAQFLLEPNIANSTAAILLYAASLGLVILAILKQDWLIVDSLSVETTAMGTGARKVPLLIFIPVALLAFYLLKDNQFNSLNVFLWLAAIMLALAALWQPTNKFDLRKVFQKVWAYLRAPFLNFHLTPWNLLVIAVFALAAFFHLSQLASVPLEMTSDHAEKLRDINDILNGNYSIFMPRNGGREPIQFYLSAALIKWFGAGLNFTTLKLGMAIAFLVGLFFVYKLGKELGNRWTGLIAMLFMGMASWTNIIARVGLRLVLCPVFVAPVLYFLIRGFRRANRNDFILTGIFLGLGLMGYSAFRIMPVAVVLGILLYLLHQKTKQKRNEGWFAFGLVTLFAVVLALPLIHFAIQYPDSFGYRTITRMTSAEVPLAGSVISVFLSNTWNAIAMPFWKDGSTWVISVTDRPALDVVSAAFYFIGLVVLIARWFKRRTWQDLFLVLSIPVLMLPSILALAFPNENPSLSRAGGAIVPIIIILAIGFQSLFSSLWQKCKGSFGKVSVVFLALGLVFVSARQNYDLVFRQYNNSYANATWNTKEMGEVCKDYFDSVGAPDTCYVVGLAYWVDTRLVAIVAGYPTGDYAIWPKDVEATTADPRAKMFIVKADHADALVLLKQIYPKGFGTLHKSPILGRDFVAYFVPPTE